MGKKRYARRGVIPQTEPAPARPPVAVTVESENPELEPPATPEKSRRILSQFPWLSVLYVAILMGFMGWFLKPGLFRTWFYSSDEYVVVAEVIRFLHLDFRQQFFDMPGTPMMALTAFVWACIYAAQFMAGIVPRTVGLEDFTFHHLPLLFTVMRAETLSFALLSVALTFFVAAKFTNRAGACVAALVVAMSPTYSSYSSFIRVESFAMCAVLAAVLCLRHALEIAPGTAEAGRREARWIFFAGLLAGIGAGARLHSIAASIPLLLIMVLVGYRKEALYPVWMRSYWKYTLAACFCAAILVSVAMRTFLPRTGFGQNLTTWWPLAFSSLSRLMLLAAVVIAAIWILDRLRFAQPLTRRVLHPSVFALFGGCAAGLLAGMPTVLWQYQYLFQSINMYSTSYLDLERKTWPLLKNISWFLKYYVQLIAPDALSMGLLAVGAALILFRWHRPMLPVLAAGVLFFVSKPINLVAAPHHMILWLPIYGMVAGFAVAVLYDVLPGRTLVANTLKLTGLAVLLAVLAENMVPGPVLAAANTRSTETRLHNVSAATDWIHKQAEPRATVAIAYYCFNPDVFYAWLRALQVPVPSYVSDGREYRIWWGDQPALKGAAGYACASPSDLPAMKTRQDQVSPGRGTDPFTDNRFRLIQTFGKQPNEIDVFRFDYTQSSR
jgi:hypothetical protein